MHEHRFGRRQFLKLAGLGVLAAGGAACGIASSNPGGGRGHKTTTTTTTTTPTTTVVVPPGSNPVPPPNTGCYFGAYIEGRQTYAYLYGGTWSNAPLVDPGTQDPWPRFEQNAGKPVKFLMHGYSVLGQPFSAAQVYLDAVIQRGAVSALDTAVGSVTLASIANGDHDAELSQWFRDCAAWGHPFVLRPWAEMNGAWYSYGAEARQNPAVFVSAWRRVHDLAVAAGATNVSWHWCPNVDPESIQTPLEQLYPGDAYVDWSGMTGYSHAGSETFDWVFSSTYQRLVTLSPAKPIMLGEIGCQDGPAESPYTKVNFLQDMFAKLPTTYPMVKAFCWFNWRIFENNQIWEWEIESSPAALSGFQAGIADAYYATR